jgi:hypothetical protein
MITMTHESTSSRTYSGDGSCIEVCVPMPEKPTGEIRLIDSKGKVKGKITLNRDLALAISRGLELEATIPK